MSSANSPEPNDHVDQPAKGRDSRLESFVRQAAPILAAERGLNETSQLKLQALANDLRLPKSLYERAISELKRSGPFVQLSRTEQQFLQFLQKDMEKLPSKILSAQMEAKAIHIGESMYQVNSQRARELVRQHATVLGLERVSQSDAEKYLEGMCLELIGDSASLSEEQLARVCEVGAHWGLDADQCAAVWQRIAQSAETPGRSKIRIHFGLISAVAGIAVIVAFIVLALRNAQPSTTHPVADSKRDSTEIIEWRIEPAAWWPDELYQRIARFAESEPDGRDDFRDAASNNAETRKRSLERMFARQSGNNSSSTTIVSQLAVEILACDPDQAVVDDVLAALGRQLTPDESSPFARAEAADAATRSATLLVQLWRTTLNTNIREQVESQFWDAYGISLRRDATASEIDAQLFVARSNAFWNQLIASAWKNPLEAIGLFRRLRQADFDDRSLRRQALFAILRASPSQWKELQDAVSELIADYNNDDLLTWLEWVDLEREPSLANFVVKTIAERLQLKLPDVNTPEAILLVRRALAPPSAKELEVNQRWSAVREHELLLIRDPANAALSEAQQIANATYVATLALILHQAEKSPGSDFTTFDELIALGAESFAESLNAATLSPIGFRQVSKPATSIERQQRDRALERLSDNATNTSERLQALVSVAEVGDRFSDIAPADATVIARFMLSREDPDDFVDIENCARRLRHWPTLVLAFLDCLETTKPPADQAIPLYAAFFGDPPNIVNQADWRSELKMLGLRSISNRIDETIQASADNQSQQWRQLERYTRMLFAFRVGDIEENNSIPSRPFGTDGALQSMVIQSILAPTPSSTANSNQRAVELVQNRFEEGLARTVYLEELLAHSLRPNPSSPGAPKGQATTDRRRTLAQRFYDAEVEIVTSLSATPGGAIR